MKLSVVLPCFNGAETIAVQLEALAQQNWDGEWEVIVSNNGSTDNSIDIVESYRDRLPNLQIVDAYIPPGPRLSAAHSYNVGLRAATGDGFVLCESDDEVDSNWLAAMAKALSQHEFVVGRMEYGKLNESWLVPDPNDNLQVNDIPRLACPPHLYHAWGCTFGLRRSLYEKLGEFDTTFPYVFDSEYCWRAQVAGIALHFVPDAVIHYRLRHDIDARFQQAQRWAEDFTVLCRCYGTPMGKLPVIRNSLALVRHWVNGAGFYVSYWRGLSDSKRQLLLWKAGLGWKLGEVRGMSRRWLTDKTQELKTQEPKTQELKL